MTRENYFKTYKCYSVTRIPTKRNIKERLKEGLKEFFTGLAAGIFGIIVVFAFLAAFDKAPAIVFGAVLALAIFGWVSAIVDAIKGNRK